MRVRVRTRAKARVRVRVIGLGTRPAMEAHGGAVRHCALGPSAVPAAAAARSISPGEG